MVSSDDGFRPTYRGGNHEVSVDRRYRTQTRRFPIRPGQNDPGGRLSRCARSALANRRWRRFGCDLRKGQLAVVPDTGHTITPTKIVLLQGILGRLSHLDVKTVPVWQSNQSSALTRRAAGLSSTFGPGRHLGRTMLQPHVAVVIDCATTDLPAAITGRVGCHYLRNSGVDGVP